MWKDLWSNLDFVYMLSIDFIYNWSFEFRITAPIKIRMNFSLCSCVERTFETHLHIGFSNQGLSLTYCSQKRQANLAFHYSTHLRFNDLPDVWSVCWNVIFCPWIEVNHIVSLHGRNYTLVFESRKINQKNEFYFQVKKRLSTSLKQSGKLIKL